MLTRTPTSTVMGVLMKHDEVDGVGFPPLDTKPTINEVYQSAPLNGQRTSAFSAMRTLRACCNSSGPLWVIFVQKQRLDGRDAEFSAVGGPESSEAR